MRLGMWMMESFLRKYRSSRVVSFIATRTDAFVDRIRSTSWKTESSKGHSLLIYESLAAMIWFRSGSRWWTPPVLVLILNFQEQRGWNMHARSSRKL